MAEAHADAVALAGFFVDWGRGFGAFGRADFSAGEVTHRSVEGEAAVEFESDEESGERDERGKHFLTEGLGARADHDNDDEVGEKGADEEAVEDDAPVLAAGFVLGAEDITDFSLATGIPKRLVVG